MHKKISPAPKRSASDFPIAQLLTMAHSTIIQLLQPATNVYLVALRCQHATVVHQMMVYNKNHKNPSLPLARPDPPHPHIVLREISPHLGRGWFANQALPAGTQLWKESPLAVATSLDDLVTQVQEDFSRFEHLCRPTSTEEGDKYCKTGTAASTDAAAGGIVHCNHFCFGPDLLLLLDDISLLNHSCNPNASVVISQKETKNNESDHDTSRKGSRSDNHFKSNLQARVQTARSIAAGEEITISYNDQALFWHWPARHNYWQERWGFSCACERCRFDSHKINSNEQPSKDNDTLVQKHATNATLATSTAAAAVLLLHVWPLLEQAAAIAAKSKPRHRSVDPVCLKLQQQAAEAVAQHLPYLKEGERFQVDAAYFS
jgi:hypothetical protein